MKGRKGLGRHPEGRVIFGRKSEVEVGSPNEMLTGIRKEARLGGGQRSRVMGRGTLSMEARELSAGGS